MFNRQKINDIYDFTVNTLWGEIRQLQDFREDILLIVNVASHCHFTKQYMELEKLYQAYHAKGFHVLAFPCNQFGQQEPANAETIQSFCETRYDITFPLFEKIAVNGPQTHPLYLYLKKSAPGIFYTEFIKWNFTKFLVDRQGSVIKRFAPITSPCRIKPWIEKLLSP